MKLSLFNDVTPTVVCAMLVQANTKCIRQQAN